MSSYGDFPLKIMNRTHVLIHTSKCIAKLCGIYWNRKLNYSVKKNPNGLLLITQIIVRKSVDIFSAWRKKIGRKKMKEDLGLWKIFHSKWTMYLSFVINVRDKGGKKIVGCSFRKKKKRSSVSNRWSEKWIDFMHPIEQIIFWNMHIFINISEGCFQNLLESRV